MGVDPERSFLKNMVKFMSASLPRKMLILGTCATLATTLALVMGVHAGIYVPASSSAGDSATSGLDPMQKPDDIGTGNYDQPQAGPNRPEKPQEVDWNITFGGSEGNKNEEMYVHQQEIDPGEGLLYRSNLIGEMLIPLDEISGSEVLLDISESVNEHIPGAVAVSYEEFILDGRTLKSVPDIAEILGRAGISQDDSLVIYGECMPCGGGPAPSTYIYWMLKSLGHKNVKVMDGTVDDWKASGRPATSETQTRPEANYVPVFKSEFIATYDYIIKNNPQVVDARATEDFEYGSIPGAINIPYESILYGDKITDEASLERTFAVLTKDRPVVVFTQTGVKGSVVWFALKLMGYDAKLYSYQDWLANQAPSNNGSDR
jgi:thiosulfate/3-mercaptopyruvate sulfurtransferase